MAAVLMYDQLSNDGSQIGIKEPIMEGEERIRHQQCFSCLLDDHEIKLSGQKITMLEWK